MVLIMLRVNWFMMRGCLFESQTATDRKEGCIVLCQKERSTCSDTATDLTRLGQA